MRVFLTFLISFIVGKNITGTLPLGVPRAHAAIPAQTDIPPDRSPPARVEPKGKKGLLLRAQQALEAHELSLATQLLTEAYRVAPRPEVLYQLGCLAMQEGRVLAAHDLLRRYLADPLRERDDEAQKTVEQLLSQPVPLRGSVMVYADPGTLLFVDRRIAGVLPLPLPLWLEPGPHTIGLEFFDKRIDAPVVAQAGRLTEMRVSRATGAVLWSVVPAIVFVSQRTNVLEDASRVFEATLEQVASSAQYTLLAADPWFAQTLTDPSCLQTESCPRELLRRNELELVLLQRAEAKGSPRRADWQLELRLIEASAHGRATPIEVPCSACSVEQAAAKLEEAATRILSARRAGNRAHGTIALPEAASAPAKAPPNLHMERAPKPRWRLGIGGALVSMGVGLSIAGGLGIWRDGQCMRPQMAEGGACTQRYETRSLGGAGLGVGAGLFVAGSILLALPGAMQRVAAR